MSSLFRTLLKRLDESEHDYCNTSVDFYNYQISEFIDKNIPKDSIVKDANDDPVEKSNKNTPVALSSLHCTVLYGVLKDQFKEISDIVSAINPFQITLRGISKFSNEVDVIKIDVESKELSALHYLLKNSVKNTYSYPIYESHITLSYVKPNSCNHLIGDQRFDGVVIDVREIMFHNTYGDSIAMPLRSYPNA